MATSGIETDVEKRCKSRCRERGRAGRTHLCQLATGHAGKHLCICSIAWTTTPAGGTR